MKKKVYITTLIGVDITRGEWPEGGGTFPLNVQEMSGEARDHPTIDIIPPSGGGK